MKKKSLYDIAMEKKNNQTTQNENIIIVRKKPIFQTIFEIIGKIFAVLSNFRHFNSILFFIFFHLILFYHYFILKAIV